MNAPGKYALTFNGSGGGGDFQLTTAGTFTGDWIVGLDGVTSLSAQLQFAYGSGGGTGKAFLQTSLDGGNTAIDVACITFATSSKVDVFTLAAGSAAIVTPGDGALADDTLRDGILGDRVRLKVVTSGSAYATQTVLAGRIVAR